MLLFRLAFRNIFRQRRRTWLTVATIAGGYVLLSVSVGFTEGSYANLIRIFTEDHTGHIQIHAPGYLKKPDIEKTLPDLEAIERVMKSQPYIRGASLRVHGGALAFAHEKTTPTQILGFDPGREGTVTTIPRKILSSPQGRMFAATRLENGAFEAVVGRQVATTLKLQAGDELILISQGADGSIANDRFQVAGVVGDENSWDAGHVYISLAAAQEFFSLGAGVHEVALAVDGHTKADGRASVLSAELNQALGSGRVSVEPWREVEADFYRSMQADKAGNVFSLGIIVVMVAIGVLNTVLMALLERTREFGVLKALGTRRRLLFGMVMLETTVMALLSILVGLIPAVGINAWLQTHGIKLSTPMEVGGMVFDRMLTELSFKTLFMPAIVAFISATIVCVWPAIRVARARALDSMRST